MRIMITGATSGIGQSLAKDYAQQGHQVIACGRNSDKLQTLVDSHETDLSHSSIEPLCFDLTDYHNFPELDKDQPLDLLILNAGIVSTSTTQFILMPSFLSASSTST